MQGRWLFAGHVLSGGSPPASFSEFHLSLWELLQEDPYLWAHVNVVITVGRSALSS
jgi:hypothetical protein